jgi:cation transport ATPase
MPHITYLHYSFCKAFLLVLAFFPSSTSFLSAAPPIDLLDKREVVTEKTERQASKSVKEREKREKRKKREKGENRPTSTFGKVVYTVLTVIGTVAAALVIVFLIGLSLSFGASFDGWLILLSILAIGIVLFGIWLILKINGRGHSRFLSVLQLILLAIATVSLATFLFASFFAGYGIGPIGLLLGIGVLYFGTWLFIRMLKR